MKKAIVPILALAVLFACKSKDSSSEKKNDKEKDKSEMRKSDRLSERRDLDENMDAPADEISDKEEASSSGFGNWTSLEEDNFMESCVSGAKASMGSSKAKAYCSCVLEKIEVKYPTAMDALKLNTEDMMQMAQDCIAY